MQRLVLKGFVSKTDEGFAVVSETGKDADYFLGLELEVEAPDRETMNKGLALKRNPKFAYAKYDGSLSAYGWELITHPISKDRWLDHTSYLGAGPVKAFLDLVKGLKDMGYTSHESGNCGLHIHVSRTAFRDAQHLYWFCRLVNGSRPQTPGLGLGQTGFGLFAKLSQRKGCARGFYYCRQTYTDPNQPIFGSNDHHRAVNLGNRATVEVRIFRGNMREDRIRKAVESVCAAVEFTQSRTDEHMNRDLDHDFVDYVSANRETYPNLHAYMQELNRPVPTTDNVPEQVPVEV